MCWHASSRDVAAVDEVGRHGSSASSVADAAATAVDEVGRQADDAHSPRDAAGGRQRRHGLVVSERERGAVLQLMLQLVLEMLLQDVGLGHGRAGRVDGLQLVIAQARVGRVLQIGDLMMVRLGGGLFCALVMVVVMVVMFEVLLCVLFFIVSVVVMLVAVIVVVQVLVLMIVMVVFVIVVVPVVFVMDEPIAIILHFRTQARVRVARFIRI